ncbi:TylF/MycF/NovP-related O-methyltransferase [Cohnella hongkongensis]|uniref:TylF/MycF/NovP-related O-methyltransferase n=1 Tax=Cohnella hongkongensis TaxID=178337 RepID=A0ABV9FF42_9BACL
MITLPDFKKSFEYENNFYLSCDITRISKILAHYELFKMTLDLPGAVVECGVFKGVSFSRFAMFRELFSSPYSRKLIGFDTFGKFPETQFEEDAAALHKFIQAAGDSSISVDQLNEVLTNKGVNKQIELISGDITQTVPEYVRNNPELKISLLNLDTDIYEPAVTILEHLYPRIVTGGVLILDDYGTFPGETKAVDDYFKGRKVQIRKFPFAMTPCYIVKEE